MRYSAKNLKFKMLLLKKSPEERSKILELYNRLKKINAQIDQTMNIDLLFEPGLFEVASIGQLSRIFNDVEDGIQETFLGLMRIDKDFLKYICKQDTWDKILSSIIVYTKGHVISKEHVIYGKEALETMPKDLPQDDKENFYEILLKLSIQNKQDFYGNYDQLLKEERARKTRRIKVLRDTKYPPTKKDLLLSLMYGFNFEEANDLIKKYGKDLEKMRSPLPNEKEYIGEENSEILEVFDIAKMKGYTLDQIKALSKEEIEELKEDKKLFEELSNIKKICETDDIREFVTEEVIEFISKNEIKSFNLFSIEQKLARSFEREYDRSLYKPKEEDRAMLKDGSRKIEASYEGKQVDVYEAKYDENLSMFLRVDGAYSDYEEPENYAQSLDVPDIEYHGNCKAFCTSDNFAIPRVNKNCSVVFGYSRCEKDSINMMAPWDISSCDANTRMASKIASWDLNVGIQYEFPRNIKDNTRHSHNEFVSERLIWDSENEKFKKDKPDFVFYEIDSEHDPRDPNQMEALSKDELWIRTQKAAAQLNIPIVLLNREEILQKETEKIEELKQIFLGKKEDKYKRSKEEILEELIVRFENNRTTVEQPNMHGKEYKEQYFTNKDRELLHNEIFESIKNLIAENKEKGKELLEKYKSICQIEIDKCYSNVGVNVDRKDFEDFYIKKYEEISEYDVNNSEDEVEYEEINEELLEYMKRIRKSIGGNLFYQEKGPHSVEHIDKVMIFADILAKEEGLPPEYRKLVVLAAMFHDCGRKNDREDKNHGVESAKYLRNMFYLGALKDFGITDRMLPLIQTMVEYHCISEDCNRYMYKDGLREILQGYWEEAKVTPYYSHEDIENFFKMCAIIKDADALDRFRFADRGTLDKRLLRTATARSYEMKEFAKRLNEDYAEAMLKLNYEDEEKNLQEGEKISSVKALHDARINSGNTASEKQIDIDKLWKDVYSKNLKIKRKDKELRKNPNDRPKTIKSHKDIIEILKQLVLKRLSEPPEKRDSVNEQMLRDLEKYKDKQNQSAQGQDT